MKIIGINPETGVEYQAEAKGIDSDFLKFLANFEMSEESVKRQIDGLDISADVKLLLYKFSSATITVGQYIVKLGRKIIDIVCTICREFPNTTFQVIFWSVVGLMVSSIPIIGAVLGSVCTPILAAFGVINALRDEIKNEALQRTISQITSMFFPLMA